MLFSQQKQTAESPLPKRGREGRWSAKPARGNGAGKHMCLSEIVQRPCWLSVHKVTLALLRCESETGREHECVFHLRMTLQVMVAYAGADTTPTERRRDATRGEG